MVKRALLSAAVLNTGAIDAAVELAAAQMVHELAQHLVQETRVRTAELGLGPEQVGRALCAAAAYWVAESASNVPHLVNLIGIATGGVDACAKGRYNERIDLQRSFRGLPGLPLRRA